MGRERSAPCLVIDKGLVPREREDTSCIFPQRGPSGADIIRSNWLRDAVRAGAIWFRATAVVLGTGKAAL